jgi:cobalt-zinc-cadmium efflux system membrane fusion protein
MKGRVTYIADLVDEATRTVKARVAMANPGRKLKPEMFATVALALTADATPVLAVPEEALQDLNGKKVVFVAEKETELVARQVETGRREGGMIEIISGLKEGERYAVKGAFILKSEIKKGEMTDEHGHGE